MEIFVIALIIGLLPAYIAHNKGRSFFGWWFYGFCLFIIALPHSLLINGNNKDLKKCPQCAELIKIEAIVCRFCGYGKSTSSEPELDESTFAEWKKNNRTGTLNDFYRNTKYNNK